MRRERERNLVRLEKAFRRVTTAHDRKNLQRFIAAVIVHSMMWRAISKNFLIAGGALLALFLVYLIS